MYNFEFARPETLADAITALAEDGAEPLAGGQTLIPSMKARLASPDTIVSLAGLPDMAQITSDSDRITIGAMATHNDVAQGAGAFPALAALAGQIGDPAVRSRGTIGGSIANNDPAACYPAAALGSNAVIITNTRRIEAQDFFLGMFETDLEEGELIISVEFPLPKRALYIKFPQPASRFAMTGVFVAEYGDNDIRVAVTGASDDGVFRWAEAEAALQASFAPEALDGLGFGDIDMVEDAHGNAAYREHLTIVMAQRAVAALS